MDSHCYEEEATASHAKLSLSRGRSWWRALYVKSTLARFLARLSSSCTRADSLALPVFRDLEICNHRCSERYMYKAHPTCLADMFTAAFGLRRSPYPHPKHLCPHVLFVTRHAKGEHLSDAVPPLAKALRVRALRPDEGMVMATQDVTKNLEGLVKALVHRPLEEGENELAGALSAVDHINRLAWRYFVQMLPYEGESVMQEVGAMWVVLGQDCSPLCWHRDWDFLEAMKMSCSQGESCQEHVPC